MGFFLYLIEVSSTSLSLENPKPEKPPKNPISKKLTKPKPHNQNQPNPPPSAKTSKQKPYQNQTGLNLWFQWDFFSLW